MHPSTSLAHLLRRGGSLALGRHPAPPPPAASRCSSPLRGLLCAFSGSCRSSMPPPPPPPSSSFVHSQLVQLREEEQWVSV